RATSPFAYETAGAARTRHSLRPWFMEGQAYGKNSGALVSRECTTTSVIPGREAKRREPGIHPTAITAAQWIPGSRCTRPGMTTERQEAHPGMTRVSVIAPSKGRIAAVDHEAVGGVIGRCPAHQIDGDAAEIRGLAEPPHRNARHHGADEFIVRQHPCGHVALDPAGQDGVGGDAVPGEFDAERADQRV